MSKLIGFENADDAAWKAKIEKDLKGAPLSDIYWKSELGEIDPVLFDYQPKYNRIRKENKGWKKAVTIECKEANSANKEILKCLNQGADAIRLKDVSPSNLESILKDVMIEIIHLTIEAKNAQEQQEISGELDILISRRGINSENAQISVVCDPLFEWFTTGIKPNNVSTTQTNVKGCLFANAGGNSVQQLAYALAQGHEYIVNSETPVKVGFRMAVGRSYFVEIAKLRALRTLWSLISEQYPDKVNSSIEITTETTQFYQSNADIHNNLLRGTTGAMSAIFGGSDVIEVLPYDMNLKDKTTDAIRLSINTHHLLSEESYLDKVSNPADGSYIVEKLTDILIEQAWKLFQHIEEKGGLISYFESGSLKLELNDSLRSTIKKYSEKEITLLGANKYLNSEDLYKEIFKEFNWEKKEISVYRLAQQGIES